MSIHSSSNKESPPQAGKSGLLLPPGSTEAAPLLHDKAVSKKPARTEGFHKIQHSITESKNVQVLIFKICLSSQENKNLKMNEKKAINRCQNPDGRDVGII